MNKLIFLAILVSIPILIGYWNSQGGGTGFLLLSDPIVNVGNAPVRVEVVDTPEGRRQGLSGRTRLGPTQGMLFVFDESAYHGVWMKGMQISIDVIWIDESLRVIGVNENLLPESFPEIYEPPKPARYAIEVNAGFAEAFNIGVGDEVFAQPNIFEPYIRGAVQ